MLRDEQSKRRKARCITKGKRYKAIKKRVAREGELGRKIPVEMR